MCKVWKEEEDAIILDFVMKNGKHWDMIANILPHRTTTQISAHWEKCLDPNLIKGPFTPQEDEIIINFVKEHGPQNWPLIKEIIPARSPKQCRERWHNHLNPNISKKEWSDEEDNFIFNAVMKFGPKWSNIAKLIPGRTDNSIKNRYNSSILKRIYFDASTGKRCLKSANKNSQKIFDSKSQTIQITQSPPFVLNPTNKSFQINIIQNSQASSPVVEQKKAPFVLPIISNENSKATPQNSQNNCFVTESSNALMNLSNNELQPEPGFCLDDNSFITFDSSSDICFNSGDIKSEPDLPSPSFTSYEMEFPAETFLTSTFDDEMF